jgi:hypothetical protein
MAGKLLEGANGTLYAREEKHKPPTTRRCTKETSPIKAFVALRVLRGS